VLYNGRGGCWFVVYRNLVRDSPVKCWTVEISIHVFPWRTTTRGFVKQLILSTGNHSGTARHPPDYVTVSAVDVAATIKCGLVAREFDRVIVGAEKIRVVGLLPCLLVFDVVVAAAAAAPVFLLVAVAARWDRLSSIC